MNIPLIDKKGKKNILIRNKIIIMFIFDSYSIQINAILSSIGEKDSSG